MDEATFTHNGINNTHNCHVLWSDENPHATVENYFLHKCFDKCAKNYLIGPFILENCLTGNYCLNIL